MTTAIVLGGAGSRGDFQVGAVRFLSDRGVKPDILCGASGGAVMAAKLAEGPAALEALEGIWRGLTDNQDMYVPEPWLDTLRQELRTQIRRFSNALSTEAFLRSGLFPFLLAVEGARLVGDIIEVKKAVEQAITARSVFNLSPIARRLRGEPLGWQRLGNPDDKGKTLCVARNLDGRLEVFLRGTANDLWHIWQTSPGGMWSDWGGLGGAFGSDVAVARNADGRLEVFAKMADQKPIHIWQMSPGGIWSDWDYLGGVLAGVPVVHITLDGRLEAFARGGGDVAVHKWQETPGGAWTDWDYLGAQRAMQGDPVIAENADGRLEVFVRGSDNALWHIWQTTPGGDWSDWQSLHGAFNSALSVARNADGRLEVFAKMADQKPIHIWQTSAGGTWSDWDYLGGVLAGIPIVARNADGRLEAFARGGGDVPVHKWQVSPGGGWTDWDYLGPQLAMSGDPVVAANSDNRLEVFVRGLQDDLWHVWQTAPSNGWSAEIRDAELSAEKVRSSGIKLRLAVTNLETAALGYVTETGQLLGAGLVLLQNGTALHRTDATFAFALADWDGDGKPDLVAVKKSNTGTGTTEVHILSGAANFQTFLLQTGTALPETDATFDFALTDWDGDGTPDLVAIKKDRTASDSTEIEILSGAAAFHAPDVDLTDGVLASGAIPGIFPPVRLQGENYVDGGIRELVPVQVAVELGADTVYVVHPSPGAIFDPGNPTYDDDSLIGIGGRTVDILLDEIRRNDINPPAGLSPANLTVIQAGLEVHDGMTIEPGLIRISMGYGYMRASDIIDGKTGNGARRNQLKGLSDQITRLRMRCWDIEHNANGRRRRPTFFAASLRPGGDILVPVPDPDTVRTVRSLKREIKRLVDLRQALGGAVPADVPEWWGNWEQHEWEPFIGNPWLDFTSTAGHVDAETAP
jgi:predicted acylesterase/phospholipase RssA